VPLIGDVDKYMAGGTTVAALYAGAVKVWPLGPPEPDGTATWEQPYELKLIISGTDGYTQGTYVIAVDPAPALLHADWSLGAIGTTATSRLWFGSSGTVAAQFALDPARVVRNDEAATWGGHLVAFTVNNLRRITAVEVLP
jgi:hypothetical protein